jgi:hypothetical protein
MAFFLKTAETETEMGRWAADSRTVNVTILVTAPLFQEKSMNASVIHLHPFFNMDGSDTPVESVMANLRGGRFNDI